MTQEEEYYADIEAHAEYEQHEWEEIERKNLSALEQFTKGLTKIDIKTMAEQAVETCLEKGNPLQVAEALSGMELFIKEVKDDKRFKDYARGEISKYPKGFTSKSGAKIECCETGTKYDFDACGDAELGMLEADLSNAESRVKERKEFLKKVPTAGITTVVPYSGEVITIYPPSKSSTSSYKVSLAKGYQ